MRTQCILPSSPVNNKSLCFFHKNVFAFSKISKDLSAKYYQDNKKDYKKKLVKDIKVFLKKNKKKKEQYGRETYKNKLEDESKSWLSIEKYKMRKNVLL